jgi:hypothetical protein
MKKSLITAILWISISGLVFAGAGQQAGSGSAGTTAAGYKEINGGQPVTLLVDFHSLKPSLNATPTAENPDVFRSTQRLADKFMSMHPNVTIEWVRGKPETNALTAAEWFTTQIAGGTAPAIAFTWGNVYLDRGWYYDLTTAMNGPNEYLEGNTRWKDQFPDYIWAAHRGMVDVNSRIIAVPFTLSAGPITVYTYNADLFTKLNIKVPSNWEDLRAACKALKAAGYNALAPWDGNTAINTDLWPLYFSIGPAYGSALLDKIDYNHDGTVDTAETLRATKANYYNPVTQENAREVWYLIKEMFTDMYSPGFETTDVNDLWNTGTLGMKQMHSGAFVNEANNTKRKFQYGLTSTPVVTSATSKYVADIEFTKSGPYQPGTVASYNMMKPAVENNKGKEEAAVAFLKFCTVPENLNEILLERQTELGAVRGSVVPPFLEDYLNRSFPIMPNVGWPIAFTSDASEAMSRELEMWVKGQINDQTFFTRWNDLMQKSADDSIRANGINTQGW